MARWPDVAPWAGPAADNFGDGDRIEREPTDRMSGHRGLVLHIAEGSYAGTISWERNSSSDVSSHFVGAKDGRRAQMVDTDDRPWTQGTGNNEWLSVEFEGYAGQPLTDPQIEFAAAILAKTHQVYGVPLQLADSPSGRGLGWHGMGAPAWGHANCPGAPIIAQRPAIIARAQQIAGGDIVTDEQLKLLVWWVQCAIRRGGGRDGAPDATAPVGYRGGPTLQSLSDQITAAAAADTARDTATQVAITALADLVRAGGGSVDTAAVLARIDQAATAESQAVAALQADLQAARQQIADLQSRLAAAGGQLAGGTP